MQRTDLAASSTRLDEPVRAHGIGGMGFGAFRDVGLSGASFGGRPEYHGSVVVLRDGYRCAAATSGPGRHPAATAGQKA